MVTVRIVRCLPIIALLSTVLPVALTLTRDRRCQRCRSSKTVIVNSRLYSEPERQQQRLTRPRASADRPTQTMFDSLGPRSIPAKPKIVVLGATGRVGRQVVRQLLQMKGVDMTVVAFVRDYEKALKVLYDDQLVISREDETNLLQNGPNNNRSGPKLQIVEGDLVPEEELPGYGTKWTSTATTLADAEEEAVWLERAESAATFYGTKVEDYDNRELIPDINESLEEAIRDATTIISVVGSVRKTNVWTDLLARPVLRLLRPDVSAWCRDAHHPFYVHYMSTRKALGFAEREQVRREAAAVTIAEADGLDVEKDLFVPRIRFIRVSDLNVAQNPWNLIPLITNMIHSVTFRYQEMAEHVLADSTLVETIVLRSGDLIDDERDIKTTAVEVSSTGSVPGPSLMGRDDVATLVVEAARFITPNETSSMTVTDEGSASRRPFHYTFATRWVGQDIGPYPAQGRKRDGDEDASVAFQKALKAARRADRAALRKDRLHNRNANSLIAGRAARSKRDGGKTASKSSWHAVKIMARNLEERQRHRIKNRRSKPHGVCVAMAVYLIFGCILKAAIVPSIQVFPGGREWVMSLASRMNQWMILLFTKIIAILPWLARGKKPTYISF